MRKKIVNLGGEGETSGIQVNGSWIRKPTWVGCDGNTRLDDIRERGHMVVVASGDALPFASGSVDVRASNVPIDGETFLGPGYSSSEINRIRRK